MPKQSRWTEGALRLTAHIEPVVAGCLLRDPERLSCDDAAAIWCAGTLCSQTGRNWRSLQARSRPCPMCQRRAVSVMSCLTHGMSRHPQRTDRPKLCGGEVYSQTLTLDGRSPLSDVSAFPKCRVGWAVSGKTIREQIMGKLFGCDEHDGPGPRGVLPEPSFARKRRSL